MRKILDSTTRITYPSGRQVLYTRDTTGRITRVRTRENATAAVETVASGIVYQPMSNLVQSYAAGNALTTWNTYTLDYELDLLGVYDGPAKVIERTHSRTDKLNLTNIWDNVATANNQTFAYSDANRLNSTAGPWGTSALQYDGVGNRTQEVSTPPGGSATTRTYTYPASSNRLSNLKIGTATERSFLHDGAGNMTRDTQSGVQHNYAYNKRNRLSALTIGGVALATYRYNGLEQLVYRSLTNMTPSGLTHFIHDRSGNPGSLPGHGVAGVRGRLYAYPASSNRLSNIKIGTATERSFLHDGAGNITRDTQSGVQHNYTYNKRNRMVTVSVGGVLNATYRYNGHAPIARAPISEGVNRQRKRAQLTYRSLTTCLSRRRPGTPSGLTHFIHDRSGNVIASCRRRASKVTDGTGPAGTVREYIYLPETEIAPTAGSRTVVDRPIAVVDAVSTAPVMWQVHVDHLNRPIRMTDANKASVWDVVWSPWGSPVSTSGAATLDARFPGQWYQLESGLHYNWHRHYDPSLGRYTQPDPLGFVDGPSVYGYAGGSAQIYVDQDGRIVMFIIPMMIRAALLSAATDVAIQVLQNMRRDNQDLPQALQCVNLSTLPFSAAGGIFGGVTMLRRMPIGSFGGRVIIGGLIFKLATDWVLPPITLHDIMNPSEAGDVTNICRCSRAH